MANAEDRAERRTTRTSLFRSGLESIVSLIAAAKARRRTAVIRKSLRDLTPDQLRDIGCPEPPVPSLDVKAGLITNLTSMR